MLVENTLLHTEIYGDKSLPTVVLLHGLMGSGRTWHQLVDSLAGQYRVVVVDILGFGDSPKPRANYHLEDHLKALSYTIDHYGLNQVHMLVGFSLGSVLSIYLVRRKLIKPDRVLLVAPPIYATKGEMKRRIKRSPTPAVFRRGPVASAMQRVRRRSPAIARRIAKLTHPAVPAIVVDDASKPTYQSYFRTRRHVLEKETVIKKLPHVKRIAILVGSHDQYADIAHLAKLIQNKGDITILHGYGHSLPFIANDDILAAIAKLSAAADISRLQGFKSVDKTKRADV